MDRRKFLIGAGSLAAGGAAALGSGAFSRVEAQRQVTIQVANDANAYLGIKQLDTPNSQNFFGYDEQGHAFIDIGKIPEGEYDGQTGAGVNSDSFTYFDGLFQLCNQGKADATVSYELPDPPTDRDIDPDGDARWEAPAEGYDQQVVAFYWINSDGDRVIVEEGQEVPLPLGECEEMGLRTVTKGVDATLDAPLIDGEVRLVANAPSAGGGGT